MYLFLMDACGLIMHGTGIKVPLVVSEIMFTNYRWSWKVIEKVTDSIFGSASLICNGGYRHSVLQLAF